MLFLNILNADEIQRIESIVNDITKLRIQYEECKNTQKLEITAVKKQEKIKIAKLEKDIENYKKLLKTKEKEIKSLKKAKTKKKKQISKKPVEVPFCKPVAADNSNKFPKLILKDKYNNENIIKTTPSSYRLNKDAKVYNAINGKLIEEWEKLTSFTSDRRSDSWVKITGFFINKVWVRAESDMWIKFIDVRKR